MRCQVPRAVIFMSQTEAKTLKAQTFSSSELPTAFAPAKNFKELPLAFSKVAQRPRATVSIRQSFPRLS